MFGFTKKNIESNKKSKNLKKRFNSIDLDLIYKSHEFTFVRAVDFASKIVQEHNVIIKSTFTLTQRYCEVCNIEGLRDGIAEIYINAPGIEYQLPDQYFEDYIIFNKISKEAVKDFFDVFNGHFYKIKYKLLKRLDITCQTVNVKESIFGCLIENLSDVHYIFDELKTALPKNFAVTTQNLFWKPIKSAENLRIMIRDFFNVKVRIEQFVGKFIKVSTDEQTAIGIKEARFNIIGQSAILGSKLWDTTKGINIFIGPLTIEDYLLFLPKHNISDSKYSRLQKLKEIIKLYVPFGTEVKVVFELNKGKTKKTELNQINRLNMETFIFGNNIDGKIFYEETII